MDVKNTRSNYDNIEKVARDDYMMLLAFGSVNPDIARFNHIISRLSPLCVKTVLSTVGAKGGVWGEEPLVNTCGEPYIPPWEPNPEDYVLWELPKNQARIDEGGIRPDRQGRCLHVPPNACGAEHGDSQWQGGIQRLWRVFHAAEAGPAGGERPPRHVYAQGEAGESEIGGTGISQQATGL